MGLFAAAKAALSGDFKTAADYAFISDAEINRGIDLDSKLLAETQSDYARGAITEEQAAVSFKQLQQSAFANQVAQSSPASGFVEGWKAGYQNVKNAIQSVTSGVLGGAWGLIPWQIKLLVAAIVLFYAYNWLKSAGILAKYLKIK